MYRLAVDLGTSNTVAVVRDAGGPARPLLFDGREQLPSAVHAGADGRLVAGDDAQRLGRADPAGFEPHPKRRIDDGTMLLGTHEVPVVEAFAAVLSAVAAQLGSAAPGGPPVLTVPAGWGAARRAVLTDAAARAGLGPVELVPEPVAAAAYYVHRLGQALPPGTTLLVVDLGAGTADVALVRARPTAGEAAWPSAREAGRPAAEVAGRPAAGGDWPVPEARPPGGAAPGPDGPAPGGVAFEVVGQGGLDVGGLDVDAALVELLGRVVAADAPQAWRRLAEPGDDDERRDRFALWQEVRAAKESLSRLSSAPVHVPGRPGGLHLTREELEAAAAPLLAPVAELAATVVAAAGAGAAPAGVLLVGGGCRLPLLGRLLHARLGVAPTTVERPETAVVEGALLAVPERGLPAVPPQPPRARRRRRRWLGPAGLALVLGCFLLPFATVSCGLPDGYGRAGAGGSSEYSGLDLAVGGRPAVPAEHVRPAAQWRPDRLGPQPAHLLALLATLAALGAGLAVADDRRRRALVAGLAGAAAASTAVGQVVVAARLADAVRAQSSVPAGRTAEDFVGTGIGFWLAVVLLALVTAGNLVLRARGRSPG